MKTETPISILIADDHAIFRESLRILLETQADFCVTAEAASGEQALALARQLAPEIILLDMAMPPGPTGLEIARQIMRKQPASRIIMLSAHCEETYVISALREGVAGYVVKERSGTDLIQAIREVLRGHRHLCAPLAEQAIATYVQAKCWLPELMHADEPLTLRERQVLKLALQGLTNAQIGRRLRISKRTAEAHRANLIHKLGLPPRTRFVDYAEQLTKIAEGG